MTAARAAGLLLLVSGVFTAYPTVVLLVATYPTVVLLVAIRISFSSLLLSANSPLFFVVAAVTLIPGAFLLRRVLVVRAATSAESNLIAALLITGAIMSLLSVTGAWAIDQVAQGQGDSGVTRWPLKSPTLLYIIYSLPILKEVFVGLAITALIPLQWRLGGMLKAAVPFSLLIVMLIHVSIATGLFLLVHWPWSHGPSILFTVLPLIRMPLPLWLMLCGAFLVAWKTAPPANDAVIDAGPVVDGMPGFGKIGGVSFLLLITAAVISAIVRRAAPHPEENLAVSGILQAIGGFTWLGAGTFLTIGAYCLWRETAAYHPVALGVGCALLAATGSLTAGSGIYVMLITLTATNPQQAVTILHHSPTALASNLWVTGFFSLTTAGLSLLCIGFAQWRVAISRDDPRRALLVWASAITAAAGLAILLIPALGVNSWGTVAGIILLLWLAVVGFVLLVGLLKSTTPAPEQNRETPQPNPAP